MPDGIKEITISSTSETHDGLYVNWSLADGEQNAEGDQGSFPIYDDQLEEIHAEVHAHGTVQGKYHIPDAERVTLLLAIEHRITRRDEYK